MDRILKCKRCGWKGQPSQVEFDGTCPNCGDCNEGFGVILDIKKPRVIIHINGSDVRVMSDHPELVDVGIIKEKEEEVEEYSYPPSFHKWDNKSAQEVNPNWVKD